MIQLFLVHSPTQCTTDFIKVFDGTQVTLRSEGTRNLDRQQIGKHTKEVRKFS